MLLVRTSQAPFHCAAGAKRFGVSRPPPMRRKLISFTVLLGGLFLLGALVLFIIPIEVTEEIPEEFDVQVVLGGNTRERAAISYRLWQRHNTTVIVTGDGGYTIEELRELGIPEDDLIHENQALTTYENAVFSRPIFTELKAKTVVIVTSDYHSARAMSCFRKVAPEIQFSIASQPVATRSGWENFQLGLRERMKRLAYAAMHGISPWSTP